MGMLVIQENPWVFHLGIFQKHRHILLISEKIRTIRGIFTFFSVVRIRGIITVTRHLTLDKLSEKSLMQSSPHAVAIIPEALYNITDTIL